MSTSASTTASSRSPRWTASGRGCRCSSSPRVDGAGRCLRVLLALTANPPFWSGRDTGFASYRTEMWTRWPTAGFPPGLRTRDRYEGLVGGRTAIGAIDEPAALFWYVRPSATFPTIEFRVCDVLLRVEDTVALSGLIRALAWTARRDAL